MPASHVRSVPVGEALLAASRQVWLAGLGAAVVTRDWAQSEALPLFRTLVREGTAIESRTFRIVGDGVESSIQRANAILVRTRSTLTDAVKTYADSATTLVRETLPRRLPAFDLPAALKPAKATTKRAKRTVKTAGRKVARGAKAAKRSVKRATKRG